MDELDECTGGDAGELEGKLIGEGAREGALKGGANPNAKSCDF